MTTKISFEKHFARNFMLTLKRVCTRCEWDAGKYEKRRFDVLMCVFARERKWKRKKIDQKIRNERGNNMQEM